MSCSHIRTSRCRVRFDARQQGITFVSDFSWCRRNQIYGTPGLWAVSFFVGSSPLCSARGDYRTLLKHLGLSCASALALHLLLPRELDLFAPRFIPGRQCYSEFYRSGLLPDVLHELNENVRVQCLGMGRASGNWFLTFNLTSAHRTF